MAEKQVNKRLDKASPKEPEFVSAPPTTNAPAILDLRKGAGVNEEERESEGIKPPPLPAPPVAARPRPPPPPLKKKSSPILTWLGYRDSASGNNYFESTEDGRVTWTEPEEGFKQMP